ncbi:MAG: hypothetical protein ACK5B3_04645 [Bacteroidota bacterium]|jgi:hypothetical protein
MKSDQIIITNPCDKDWNSMQVNNQGKFCDSCNKTVIDFSTWEVEEIKDYLKSKNHQVCGHFNALQVASNHPMHKQYLIDLFVNTEKKIKIPLLKSIFLYFFISFKRITRLNRPLTGNVERINRNPDEFMDF